MWLKLIQFMDPMKKSKIVPCMYLMDIMIKTMIISMIILLILIANYKTHLRF